MDEDFDLAVEHGQLLLVGPRFAQSIPGFFEFRDTGSVLTVNLLHRRSRLIELTPRNDLLLEQRFFAFEIGPGILELRLKRVHGRRSRVYRGQLRVHARFRLHIDEASLSDQPVALRLDGVAPRLKLFDEEFRFPVVDLDQHLIRVDDLAFRHRQRRHPAGDATADRHHIARNPRIVFVHINQSLMDFAKCEYPANNNNKTDNQVANAEFSP